MKRSFLFIAIAAMLLAISEFRVQTFSIASMADVGPTIPLNISTWTSLGPAPIVNGQFGVFGSGPVSGRITGIATHPTDPRVIYVAAAGGGVWKTVDGGMSWAPLTDFQPTLSMGAIAIAPSDPNVIYAGTGEANGSLDSNPGLGVLISVDAGLTWTLRNPGNAFEGATIAEIVVDPTDASTAYVAAGGSDDSLVLNGNTGIWKTVDGGLHWANTTTSITTTGTWSSVKIDNNEPSTLYAAVWTRPADPATPGVYKSIDNGTNWTLLTEGPTGPAVGRLEIAIAPSNPQVIYVATSGRFGMLFKFMRSDDGGITFTDLTEGMPNYLGNAGNYDTTLAVDPTNPATVYAGGQLFLIRSMDSGATWTDVASGSVHVDYHAAAFTATGQYLAGTDGGVFRLDTPSPAQWTSLNTDLSTIQFQGIALHPTDPNITFGGSQDNGTSMYTGRVGWTQVEGGDGGLVKFSQNNPLRIYHQAPIQSFGPTGFFRRSDDGGTTWVSKTTGLMDTVGFYAPFVVDPSNGDRVLFGAAHVWETVDGGDSWHPLGSAFPFVVQAIGLSPSDVNRVYVSSGSSVFVTDNLGATWTQTSQFPGISGITRDIQVDATDPLTAYVVVTAYTFSPFTATGKILKTIDAGATWTNITGDLPPLLAWSLQIHAGAGKLYVGNDDGVYVTTNEGLSWRRLGAGLPRAQVFQIELNDRLRTLAAGIHGRGLWEIGGVCGCDVNLDAQVNVVDVQLIVNQALGVTPATCDVNSDGVINVSDVQIVVNAALGRRCNGH